MNSDIAADAWAPVSSRIHIRFSAVVSVRVAAKCRLGRNLRHLITLLEELLSLGVAFVSLAEGIDATTPAGKLQMRILGAIAEFERPALRNGSRRASSAPGRKGNVSAVHGTG
jgi:DNA invertase Pin-like site-specific DNA recombinase